MTPNDNLVERVARAIEPEEGYWQHFLPEARAAIAVVLEEAAKVCAPEWCNCHEKLCALNPKDKQ